ncbi:NAD(P)/FAD-dependent oxidoreductase [Actinotalea sp. M2MS4P-6]|uniref:NAD(P)/FAD-dependent oxidoreductase n=1 Tax=Actinotalea sp. M2MS4P-6 TaxID=2983762 RepID=UPI0021E4A34C|nr:NAD(P)/FAD-dependent oxidoreductase [Actinotalea sp. M2MS4P-6]MCV2394283.1 NAD(P)/FAD-dependent oxidoreductase [Actinotalea sp. M2MS4P-6]
MGSQFPILSSPIQVGGVVLKNRMMTTSMSPGVGYVDENSRPTTRFLNYLEQRAAGQTALICQTVSPHERPEGFRGHHRLPGAYDESCLDHLGSMARVVHDHGGLLVGQPYFVHEWKSTAQEEETDWGPSDISILPMMGPFKAMTLEHIEIFKRQFVDCAVILKDAGWDGVEVMAGVGGILNRFLSPATNNRTDRYGGSLENRVRLTVEVIEEIRAAVGPDYPILVRWSPVDYVKSPIGEGHTIEQALEVVPYLEAAGADLHNLAVGWHETSIPLTTKQIADGHWSWISEKIKTVATKPVVTAYRETDPEVMESVLREGKADVIGGLRYSIADPAFPRKVMEDRPEDIAMCICCNRCIDDVVSKGLPLERCAVNPRLGAELDELEVPRTTSRKKVLVAGSGPAGLSAAFTAAERGHDVVVYEAGPRVGGSTKMSAIFSPMHERLLRYYRTKLAKHPEVKVVLRTPVTPELVRRVKPDAVVVAIGGEPKGIDVPGADGPNVVTSHDFLQMLNSTPPRKQRLLDRLLWTAGATFLRFYYTPGFARRVTRLSPWPLSRSLAIIGGGLPGCELGELAMHSGRTTTIVEEGKRIAYDVSASERFHVRKDFKEAANVTTYQSTTVTRITPDGLVGVQHGPEGETEVRVSARTVAVTLGFEANRGLYEALSAAGVEVHEAGDCADPGRIADATKAGYRAAVAI